MDNVESYEQREVRIWQERMNDHFRLSKHAIVYKQCNRNNPMREYRGEPVELPQELYETMTKMYAVPYKEGHEALWSSWKSCGTLPEDGSLRRPTFWEAQLRFNMQNYLGIKDFVICCNEYKNQSTFDLEAVREFEHEIMVRAYQLAKLEEMNKPVKLHKGWVDNEC
ncbi:MAG: hypothetical protein PHY48_15325 [Candidatus Cloacimonetes bacterium]|nr:hypothetical protein [Candidatus Cloacimonadota bacterium]